MSVEINRRDLVKIGAGAVLAVPAALAVADAPRFFTPAEFAMLDELTEIIIPTDEHSPGARAAKVAAYIDARTAEAFEAKDREMWRGGLKRVDALSNKMLGCPFLKGTPAQRVAVVITLAAHEKDPKSPEDRFFAELKSATVRAYYTSSIGIHRDMNYLGNVMLDQFVGYEVP